MNKIKHILMFIKEKRKNKKKKRKKIDIISSEQKFINISKY